MFKQVRPRGDSLQLNTDIGRKSKYDPDFHHTNLIALMEHGWSVASVASEWDICLETFYAWVRNHKEFSDVYKRAKAKKMAWFEHQARDNLNNKQYNAILYSMLARSCGGLNTEERALDIDIHSAKTAQAKVSRIEQGLATGALTVGEADKLMNIVEKGQRVVDLQEMEQRIKDIEARVKEI